MEYRRRNFAAAVELLRQSVAMDPTNAKAHNDLGLALFALGHDQAAFASLMRGWTRDKAGIRVHPYLFACFAFPFRLPLAVWHGIGR
jgi:lipoprotein NlpI